MLSRYLPAYSLANRSCTSSCTVEKEAKNHQNQVLYSSNMSAALRRLSQPLAQRLSGHGLALRPQTRGFAADAHGDVKVNCWEAPTNISQWKEEHIVLVVLGTWGVVIYTCLKTFGGKKEQPSNAPAPPVAPAS